MTKQILVATDGSDTAQRAVDMAAELAAKFGAKLTIAHVLMHGEPAAQLERMAEVEHMVAAAARGTMPAMDDVPGSMTALFRGSDTADHTARLVTVVGEEIARRAAERARSSGAPDVQTKVVQGDYAEQLIGLASETGADLIVLGRRGLGAFQRILQGSVSQKVISHAECPVLTVI